MKTNFYNCGQSLIGIIIVLVAVGLMTGGLYYYFSKQIPEIPEITQKPAEEGVKPETVIPTQKPETTCQNECSSLHQMKCVGKDFQVCGYYDEDNCLEWGPIVSCPTNTVCQNGNCVQQKCLDGPIYGQCSVNDKPKFCENGNLINKCSVCGCDTEQNCKSDGRCSLVKSQINITAYIQTGVAGVNEAPYRTFIENINQLYLNNGTDVDFNVGRIEWYNPGQDCGRNFYGNDVIMCVGPGKGGFLGSPYFIVGANTDIPFGFSSIGVMAEAHELAHYLGFQDLYWLRSLEPLRAPIVSEIENDIMTDPYTLSNAFGEHAKYVLNTNFERLKKGSPLLYPKDRMASKLNISTGLPNQNCQVYTRERDYNLFKSRINEGPSLIKTTDNLGNFQMDIIGGDAADNNFDIYYLACGLNKFWINSLATEDCFKKQGPKSVCNIRCLNPNGWCEFYQQ